MSAQERDIERIYHEVLEKPAEEREAYLDVACADNTKLRSRVEALLKANEAAGDFLKVHPDFQGFGPEARVSEEPGSVIGRYELIEKIGEGGMAVVYLAEQKQPIQRQVALKIIKLGMDTKQVIARFELERQALAMMDHPNIAKILFAGATETGRPYFVMELVQGVSITEYCDNNSLSIQERLELFIQVCHAVQHAHQKGVIHRDLKPSNVMVVVQDDKPLPKIIDFGIAKAIEQKLTEKTIFTRYEQLIGTPEYMSPEQAEAGTSDIDTRTDVYSLGILLYQLLTGVTPFDAKTLREAGYAEIQRIIREVEPVKPSTKLSNLGEAIIDIAKHHKTNPNMLPKLIHGDLDWIVMKSLEKDRARRYETVTGFANDIQRHLKHEAVKAAAPSILYKFRKFIRRHQVATVISLIIAAAICLSVVILATSTVMIWQEQKKTEQARDQEAAAKKEAVLQRDDARRSQYIAQMRLAPTYLESSQVGKLREMLHQYIPEPGQEDLRGWEWYYFLSQCYQERLTLRGHIGKVYSVVWSPDGKYIASGSSDDSTAKIWNATTGQYLHSFYNGDTPTDFNPDGSKLATGDIDGKTLIIWDINTQSKIRSIESSKEIWHISWSPNGRYIATGMRNNVTCYDMISGEELYNLDIPKSVSEINWSNDGKYLAVADQSDEVRIYDVQNGKFFKSINYGLNSQIFSVSWSPDDKFVLGGGYSGIVKIFDVQSGACKHVFEKTGSVDTVSWSPDGKYVAAGTREPRIIIWNAQTGLEVKSFIGHSNEIKSIDWSPDSTQLVSCGFDGTVKIWDFISAQENSLLGRSTGNRAVAWSSDGKFIATVASNDDIQIWEKNSGKKYMILPALNNAHPWSLNFSRDGSSLVSGGWGQSQTCSLWNWRTGKLSKILPTPKGRTFSPEFSPDGKMLACGTPDGRVQVWNLVTGDHISLTGHRKVPYLSWSPKGDRIVTVGQAGSIKVWDTKRWNLIKTLNGQRMFGWVGRMSWSPDGKQMASGGFNKIVTVWDMENYVPLKIFKSHTSSVIFVDWSPDGNRIISASMTDKNNIWLWDPTTGQEIMKLQDAKKWSPDGKCVAGIKSGGKINILDASRGYEVASSPFYWEDMARQYWFSANQMGEQRNFVETERLYRCVLNILLQLVESYPQVPRYQRFLAETYRGVGDVLLCTNSDTLEPAKQAYKQTLNYLENLNTRFPENEEYQRALARYSSDFENLKQRQDKVFLIHYDYYSYSDAIRSSQYPVDNPKSWIDLGWSYYSTKRTQKAINCFQRASEFDNSEARILSQFFLALAYGNLGEKDKALKSYEKAVQELMENPEFEDSYPYLQKEAAELLGIDQEDHPIENESQIYHGMGFIHAHPNTNTPTVASEQLLARSVANLLLKRWQEADSDFIEAIELYPKHDKVDSGQKVLWENASHLAALIASYNANVGDYDATEKWQRKAISLLPEDSPISKRVELKEKLQLYLNKETYRSYPDKTMIAWWKFDEVSGTTTVDSAGYGHDGSLQNDLNYETNSVPGQFGNALSFDRVGSYVEAPPLNIRTNTVTVTAWIKRIGNQNLSAGVVHSRNYADTARFALRFRLNNELGYNWNDKIKTHSWDSGLVVPDNKWIFTVLIIQPDKATIYLHDGSLQSATNNITNNVITLDSPICFGMDRKSEKRNFRGIIDDVRIYNYALTEDEIKALYEGNKIGSSDTQDKLDGLEE